MKKNIAIYFAALIADFMWARDQLCFTFRHKTQHELRARLDSALGWHGTSSYRQILNSRAEPNSVDVLQVVTQGGTPWLA